MGEYLELSYIHGSDNTTEGQRVTPLLPPHLGRGGAARAGRTDGKNLTEPKMKIHLWLLGCN